MYTKFTVFIRNVSYELGGVPEMVTISKTPRRKVYRKAGQGQPSF